MESMEVRVERLRRMVDEDRIIRAFWEEGAVNGRVHLLVALSPEVGEAEDATACPVEVMPAWFADFTMFVDDSVSKEAWPALLRRYADLAARWSVLDADAWRRCEVAARRIAVDVALPYVRAQDVRYVCQRVIAWFDAGQPEVDRADLQTAVKAVAARWNALVMYPTTPEARAVHHVGLEVNASGADAAAAAMDADSAAKAANAATWAGFWSDVSDQGDQGASDRVVASVLDAIEAEIQAVR